MSPRLKVGARSDVGRQRQENQDSMYAGPWLIAVADGVGGAAHGEVASRLAITALMPLDNDGIDDPEQAMQRAAADADATIRDNAAAHSELSGMSTTLTAMLASDDAVTLAHIGDSRAYRLRGGALEQLTRDHTLVQALIDDGQITEAEADTHPQRSWIMRALDGRGHPEIDVTRFPVEPGDRYLVCSDGLSSYVSEADITSGLAASDPQEAAERLVDLALEAGGPDNVTCIVADPVSGQDGAQDAILGGAVAEVPPTRATDTAAQPVAKRTASPRRRSIGRRLAAVTAIVVILIAAGVAGVAVYIHRQWYVAASGGNVAVFQGVQGTAAGVSLSHRHAITNIPVTALPQDDRDQVANGIEASGGLSGADTVVANLRRDACALATPTPQKSHRAGGKHHHHKPTPPPTPEWCVTSP
jgi:serine/threonine protein phosphatase PrpC